MKAFLLLPLLALAGGVTLSTKYTTKHELKFDIETKLAMETTSSEMLKDGEPVEGGHDMGKMASETSFKEVHVDTIVSEEKGAPVKVKRHFEKVSGHSSFSFGDNTNERDMESPFDGMTLALSKGAKDEVTVEVVDGKKPEDDKALANHGLTSFLDALLPDGDVEKGAKWDLDDAAVKKLLRLDVHAGMFPPPKREDAPAGGGGGGGRRGGGMRMGGGDAGLLEKAEWKGTAKLVALDEEIDGAKCAKIQVKLTASGDLPEPPQRARPSRDAFMPESMEPALANTYTIALEGTFLWAVEARRPMSLEIEGTVVTDSAREMKRGESTMSMKSKREGKLSMTVKVTEEGAEKTAKKKE